MSAEDFLKEVILHYALGVRSNVSLRVIPEYAEMEVNPYKVFAYSKWHPAEGHLIFNLKTEEGKYIEEFSNQKIFDLCGRKWQFTSISYSESESPLVEFELIL